MLLIVDFLDGVLSISDVFVTTVSNSKKNMRLFSQCRPTNNLALNLRRRPASSRGQVSATGT